MEYKNDSLGVSFTVPDTVTVRKQLQYKRGINKAFVQEVSSDGDDFYPLFFDGAKAVIENWQCELIPNINELNMDTATSPKVADIVFWTCNIVAGHMNNLEAVPKNS